MANSNRSKGNPIRPLVALRAVRKLFRNPKDTALVFEVIRALSGNSLSRTARRFARTPEGARILSEQRSLLTTLLDRDALAAMPEGSLGRVYLAFCIKEGITADGLVEASTVDHPAQQRVDERTALVGMRIRDMHDLWHVVTGYQTDLLGEASLLAFSVPQIRNPGVAFIVAAAMLASGRKGAQGRRTIGAAFVRGLRAQWLVIADWEQLLRSPLEDVRQQLGLGETPDYTRVYQDEPVATAA